MKVKIGCFQDIDSLTMQDRLHEVVYNYKASYKAFYDELEIPSQPERREMLCPHCGGKLIVLVQSRKRLFINQAFFLFIFIATVPVPVSLFLFDRAVDASSGAMWTVAALFFIFGCMFTGFIAFDIRQYEFESLYRIKNREFVKTPDGTHSFSRHKTFEEDYIHQFEKIYLIFRIVYAFSILLFLVFFYRIVVMGASDFNFILFSLVLLLTVSLPLLRLVNYLYDKYWGKTIRLR